VERGSSALLRGGRIYRCRQRSARAASVPLDVTAVPWSGYPDSLSSPGPTAYPAVARWSVGVAVAVGAISWAPVRHDWGWAVSSPFDLRELTWLPTMPAGVAIAKVSTLGRACADPRLVCGAGRWGERDSTSIRAEGSSGHGQLLAGGRHGCRGPAGGHVDHSSIRVGSPMVSCGRAGSIKQAAVA
jgi:hypothetical protein